MASLKFSVAAKPRLKPLLMKACRRRSRSYITGHSLGGALAQIASAALNRDNLAACYTFGSPPVGTAGLDEQVKCPHYRVINNWDLVPGLPLGFFRGYRHNRITPIDAQNIVCTSPRPVRRLSLQYRRNSPRDTAHDKLINDDAPLPCPRRAPHSHPENWRSLRSKASAGNKHRHRPWPDAVRSK